MEQTAQSDSNNAFFEVKRAIKGLKEFEVQDQEDDVIYAANKLNSVLRAVHDNYRSWNNEFIREFVLSKNDPLRYIDVKSDQFNRMVRQIQEDMIFKFS
ncbi:hypothetical protein [Methylomonas sp. MgM2]